MTGLRPASPTASDENWNFSVGVLNAGVLYSNPGSESSTMPFSLSSSRLTPTVSSWAAASSSTVNGKYSPTPHASARPAKISSHGFVSGWMGSSTCVRMAT